MNSDKSVAHIVIDIETLGTVSSLVNYGSCPVLEAAFVVVENITGQYGIGSHCLASFNLEDQANHGIDFIDPDTAEWHNTRNKKNSETLGQLSLSSPKNNVQDFVTCVDIALMGFSEVHYWARGKEFDFTILNALADAYGLKFPWQQDYGFTKIHCLRDVIWWTGFDAKSIPNSNPHRALPDAMQEAHVLIELLNQQAQK